MDGVLSSHVDSIFHFNDRRFLIFLKEYRQTFYCSEDHLDRDPNRELQIELRGGRCLPSHVEIFV